MNEICNISAVLFDMDGTLIDSEVLSEPVVQRFCHESGIGDVDYDWTDFHGVMWEKVALRLAADHPGHNNIDAMARRLHELWELLSAERPPPPVPGAQEAIAAAYSCMQTAIVTSAFRESIDRMVTNLDIAAHITHRVGAEDYERSKPEPDGFLHAASLLGVPPAECLVFEDSLAGLQAGRAAGMSVIAITLRSNAADRATEFADRAIRDYEQLEPGFFDSIASTRAMVSPANAAGD